MSKDYDRGLLVAFCMFDTFACTKEQAEWKVGRFLASRQPQTDEVAFERGDDPVNEWCKGCGEHIRRHYGGTEYRCHPRPDGATTPVPPPKRKPRCGKYMGDADATSPQLTCVREKGHPGLCDRDSDAPDPPAPQPDPLCTWCGHPRSDHSGLDSGYCCAPDCQCVAWPKESP